MARIALCLAGFAALSVATPATRAEPVAGGRTCLGWLNYHRDDAFGSGNATLGEQHRGDVELAFSASREQFDRPVFVESGGGTPFDPALSARRSAAISRLLVARGVPASRTIVVTPASAGEPPAFGPVELAPDDRRVAPDGLRIYTDLSRPC